MRHGFARIAAAVALLFGSALALPVAGTGPAEAQISGNCQIWTTSQEDDGAGGTHLTASACAAAADDSTAIGVQCPRQPQIRFYPNDQMQATITRDNAVLPVDFSVGDDTVTKPMRYDLANGVFWATVRASDHLFDLLQSGGPLDASNDVLGTHRFRLVGSTGSIGMVLAACRQKLKPLPPVPATPPDAG